jgi:hypothetical protein
VKNKETENGRDLSSLATLSADELARVAGGAVLVVEDGKEQYPANIHSLLRTKGHSKKGR